MEKQLTTCIEGVITQIDIRVEGKTIEKKELASILICAVDPEKWEPQNPQSIPKIQNGVWNCLYR